MKKRLAVTLFSLFFILFSVGLSAESDNSSTGESHSNDPSVSAVDHDAAASHDEAHGDTGGEFNVSDFALHHIKDAHEWHFFGDVSIPLPVILINYGDGDWYNVGNWKVDMFMSSKLHGDGHGASEYMGYVDDHGKISAADGSGVIDISITKNVVALLLVALIMILVFTSVARAYKKRPGQAPRGLQGFVEPMILFVRDEIAVPNIGAKADKFLPYLLCVFFFIWIGNMLGLIPFIANPNLTGNIAVTAALSVFTMFYTNLNGTKDYWKHIFWPPHVPIVIKPILIIIELVGVFTKPFALMIRLFANISAGHIIIIGLVSLVFLWGQQGQNPGMAFVGGGVSVIFVLFMSLIELLVAFLQAFIFTLLSALFIGLAVEEHEHAEH